VSGRWCPRGSTREPSVKGWRGWRRRGLPAVLAVGLLGGVDGAAAPPAAGAGVRPAAPAGRAVVRRRGQVLLELPHGLRAELHQGCWTASGRDQQPWTHRPNGPAHRAGAPHRRRPRGGSVVRRHRVHAPELGADYPGRGQEAVVARRPAQPVHWCGYQGLYALFGLCANGARSSGRGQLVDLQGRVLLGRRHAARNSAGAPCLNRAANLLHALCSRYVGSGHLLRTLPLPAARSPAGRIRSIDRASPNRPTNERLRGGLCVLRTRSHARSEHRRTAPAHSPETVAPPSAAEAPESTSETPRPE